MALIALYAAIAWAAGILFGPVGIAIAMGVVIAIHLFTFERKASGPADESREDVARFIRGARELAGEVLGVVLVLCIGFVVLSGLLSPGSCSSGPEAEHEYRAP